MKRKTVENEKLNTLSENLLSSLHHRDKSGRFSEKGVMELSEAERKLLLDWLEAETYEDYKGFHVSTNKIKDVYAGLSMNTYGCLGEICLLTYTIEREKGKECIGQVRYPSSRVSHKDAEIISESMKYFLQNIPLTATVKQAVDALKEFQRNYK